MEKLGIVDAERFVATIKRESYDYTLWRRKYFDNLDLDQVSEEAAAYIRKHTHKGKGIKV